MKVLIIDDEKKARDGVKLLLKDHSDIEIIGECKNGKEAIEMIIHLKPDLIFLDIQMPGINGFDVLSSISEEQWPLVIFTTAYDQYALQAFEVQALDYLLKPFDLNRFNKSLELARKRHHKLSNHIFEDKLKAILSDYQLKNEGNTIVSSDESVNQSQVIIKSSGKIYFLKTDDILWIEALDSYVKIHLQNKTHTIKSTLKLLEKRLNNSFIRIHKSHLVNTSKIILLEPYFNGDFYLTLENREKIKGSRNYRKNIPKTL